MSRGRFVIWRQKCGSCTVAHVEKLFMQENHPTLEKVISARLMRYTSWHSQSTTFIVIYQLATKTHHHDSVVVNRARPPVTQSWTTTIWRQLFITGHVS